MEIITDYFMMLYNMDVVDYLMYTGVFFIGLFLVYAILMKILSWTMGTALEPIGKLLIIPFVIADWMMDKFMIFWPVVGEFPRSWKDLVTDRVRRYKTYDKDTYKYKFGNYICKLLDKHDYRGSHC